MSCLVISQKWDKVNKCVSSYEFTHFLLGGNMKKQFNFIRFDNINEFENWLNKEIVTRKKSRACEDVGIKYEEYLLDSKITQKELIELIEK